MRRTLHDYALVFPLLPAVYVHPALTTISKSSSRLLLLLWFLTDSLRSPPLPAQIEPSLRVRVCVQPFTPAIAS